MLINTIVASLPQGFRGTVFVAGLRGKDGDAYPAPLVVLDYVVGGIRSLSAV